MAAAPFFDPTSSRPSSCAPPDAKKECIITVGNRLESVSDLACLDSETARQLSDRHSVPPLPLRPLRGHMRSPGLPGVGSVPAARPRPNAGSGAWGIALMVAVSLACSDPPSGKGGCHPALPSCADEDYDGDGVTNADDAFPFDERCAAYSLVDCLGCGASCDPTTEWCNAGVCETGCQDDQQCQRAFRAAAGDHCVSHKCRACRAHKDCPTNEYCADGDCVVGCVDDDGCPDGNCFDNKCSHLCRGADGQATADCNDGNGCTDDACVKGTCLNKPTNDGLNCGGTTCAPSYCTKGVCKAGQAQDGESCSGSVAYADRYCTQRECNQGVCVVQPANEGQECVSKAPMFPGLWRDLCVPARKNHYCDCFQPACKAGKCAAVPRPAGSSYPGNGKECDVSVCDGKGGVNKLYKPSGTPCTYKSGVWMGAWCGNQPCESCLDQVCDGKGRCGIPKVGDKCMCDACSATEGTCVDKTSSVTGDPAAACEGCGQKSPGEPCEVGKLVHTCCASWDGEKIFCEKKPPEGGKCWP